MQPLSADLQKYFKTTKNLAAFEQKLQELADFSE